MTSAADLMHHLRHVSVTVGRVEERAAFDVYVAVVGLAEQLVDHGVGAEAPR